MVGSHGYLHLSIHIRGETDFCKKVGGSAVTPLILKQLIKMVEKTVLFVRAGWDPLFVTFVQIPKTFLN